MSSPWSPERVISNEKAVMMIEKQFPQLKPVSIQVFGEGFDNSVFLVNEQFVFRFPRREIAVNLLRVENRLLPVAAPLLPIPVPDPIFQGNQEEGYPWPFAGYKLLSGKPLSCLTPEQRMLSVEPLAKFLKTLHAFPINEAEKLGVPYDELGRTDIFKRKPMLEANIEKAKELGLIGEQEQERLHLFLSTVWKPFEDDSKTLVHGDFHIRNMLVDDSGRVSAVIDWGDAHIGSPAIDLSIVYSFIPAEGRDYFFQLYGNVTPEIKMIARFRAVYSLIMLLLYGDSQKDERLVNEGRTALGLALDN
ncbi:MULTISPECIES: phosphotransferase [Neobacillus]|uniref:Phosphotransferase n=1 Tax=Neobacillus rhizophilus TaxID=2833579 RepID=A0A942U7C1_9BACI|nr:MULTISPECIES: phosphotransferase [Neobacillus]MBS4213857.1 phosphotransferase [Neobacillus rhizophilus]MBU8917739.1 phosphotransferase [Bacillus sp. FJAT-29953]